MHTTRDYFFVNRKSPYTHKALNDAVITEAPSYITDPANSIIPNGLIESTRIKYKIDNNEHVGEIYNNGPITDPKNVRLYANYKRGFNQVDMNDKNKTYKVRHLVDGKTYIYIEVPRDYLFIKIVENELTYPPPPGSSRKFQPLIKDLIIDLAKLSKQINNSASPISEDLLRKHAELKEIIKKIIN